MQLDISSEYESLIKARAHAAGFEDRVGEYLIRLLTQDAEHSTPGVTDLANSSPEEVSLLIDEGYASGIAGEMDKAYFNCLRDDLRQQDSGNQTKI